MNPLKKCLSTLLCCLLALSLSACSLPAPGFADYDVSGYVKALLDSSYHGDHESLMEITGVTREEAQENTSTTVENAAVRFCNTYGVSPSDGQLQELKVVMEQAFALTRYTVKEERKVDDGYYLEVEIAPIVSFEGREAEMEALRTEAHQEVTETEDVNDLFVDKVLEFCKRELANISYDSDTRTVALDILQTEDGELQLDLNQIETIDETVIRF